MELAGPFPRLTYTDALARYGCDKPDLRYGLEHTDVSDAVRCCSFRCAAITALEVGDSQSRCLQRPVVCHVDLLN